ncbi:MAG TPA: hypothetical protein VHX40_07970, partial [Acidimicrobiales bacterium]|nr:hypothetical protein [Acidimicrobiales bacterium]
MLFEEGEGLTQAGRGGRKDAVELELVGGLSDGLTCGVVADFGHEVAFGETDLQSGVFGAEVEHLAHRQLADEEPPRSDHGAGHALLGEGVDEMSVRLNGDGCSRAAEVQDDVRP